MIYRFPTHSLNQTFSEEKQKTEYLNSSNTAYKIDKKYSHKNLLAKMFWWQKY